MSDWLFDTPWWLLALLAVGGLAALYFGNLRRDKVMMLVGIVCVVAGMTLGLLSHFIETDVELVVRRTRTLASSAVQRDWATFRSILSHQTSFAGYRDIDQLVEGARKTADSIGLKSIRFTSMEARQTDTLITVDLAATTEQEMTGGQPVITAWRLEWQDVGNGWSLYKITPLKSQMVDPEQIYSRLVRP
ncbi:MAG: hypothetical protein ACREJC_19735 [Tepidisphaeraceae bacterium]